MSTDFVCASPSIVRAFAWALGGRGTRRRAAGTAPQSTRCIGSRRVLVRGARARAPDRRAARSCRTTACRGALAGEREAGCLAFRAHVPPANPERPGEEEQTKTEKGDGHTQEKKTAKKTNEEGGGAGRGCRGSLRRSSVLTPDHPESLVGDARGCASCFGRGRKFGGAARLLVLLARDLGTFHGLRAGGAGGRRDVRGAGVAREPRLALGGALPPRAVEDGPLRLVGEQLPLWGAGPAALESSTARARMSRRLADMQPFESS